MCAMCLSRMCHCTSPRMGYNFSMRVHHHYAWEPVVYEELHKSCASIHKRKFCPCVVMSIHGYANSKLASMMALSSRRLACTGWSWVNGWQGDYTISLLKPCCPLLGR